jgi:hypothetical protein
MPHHDVVKALGLKGETFFNQTNITTTSDNGITVETPADYTDIGDSSYRVDNKFYTKYGTPILRDGEFIAGNFTYKTKELEVYGKLDKNQEYEATINNTKPLAHLARIVNKDADRNIINCLNVTRGGLTATDSYRLLHHAQQVDIEGIDSFNIPLQLLQTIVKLKLDNLTIKGNNTCVWFHVGDTIVHCYNAYVAESFPNWRTLVPSTNDVIAGLPMPDIKGHLDFRKMLTGLDKKLATLHISLSADDNKCWIEDSETGRYETTITEAFGEIEVGVNPVYLQEMGCQTLSMVGVNKPILLGYEDTDYMGILMTVRI